MMKKITTLTLLFSVLFCSRTIAQKVKYTLDNKGDYKDMFISHVLKWDDDVQMITSIPQLNKLKSNVVTYSNGKANKEKLGLPFKNGYVSDDFVHDGRYYRLALQKNKKERKLVRQLCEFNTEGQYIDIKPLKEMVYNKFADFPQQEMVMTDNDSLMLTVDIYDEDKKKEDHLVEFAVYSTDGFEKLRDVQIKKSGKLNQRLVHFHDQLISENGDVYGVYQIHQKGKEYKKVKGKVLPNFHHELVKYSADGEITTFKIPNRKYFHNEMSLFKNKNGKVFIVSIFRHDKSYDSHGQGLSVFTIDETTGKLKANHHVFDKDEIIEFGNWSKKKSKQGIKPNTKFRGESLKSDDGSIHIQAERRTEPWRRNATSKYQTIVLESSIVFSISEEGEVINNFHVPKFFETEYFYGYSKLFFHNGKPALIYNDLYSNYKIKVNNYKKFNGYEIFGNGPNHVVLAYQDDTGRVKREAITDSKKGFAYTKHFDENDGNPRTIFVSGIRKLKFPDVHVLTLSPTKQ